MMSRTYAPLFLSAITFASVAPVLGWNAPARAVTPVTTSFTYQGQLKFNGAPLTGAADLRFLLYDGAGSSTQIGSTVVLKNVAVNNGLVTVELDFGVNAFEGSGRWLQIAVRSPAGSGAFSLLSPRQA